MPDNLNPNIRTIQYGKRTLKSLTLYPLSLGDQFKVTNIITEVAQELVKYQFSGNLGDATFMTTIVNSLEKNIGSVLLLITDITEEQSLEILNDITNDQVLEIVEYIWEVSYEPSLKKGQSLFERAKNLLSSRRSSPDSSSITPSTDLTTSIERGTKTED